MVNLVISKLWRWNLSGKGLQNKYIWKQYLLIWYEYYIKWKQCTIAWHLICIIIHLPCPRRILRNWFEQHRACQIDYNNKGILIFHFIYLIWKLFSIYPHIIPVDSIASCLFQKRNTEQNFMLINLIVSELAISLVAIPIDLVGSISHGTLANDMSCSLQGFIHTFFGKYFHLKPIDYSYSLIIFRVTYNICMKFIFLKDFMKNGLFVRIKLDVHHSWNGYSSILFRC